MAGASVAGVAAADELRRLGYDGELVVLGEETRTPYDRPPLSKEVLAGAQEECPLRPAQWAGDLDINVRLGETAIRLDLDDRAVELASGEKVGFDGLVISTGSTPRVLAGPRLEGVFTLRTLDDSLALREAIAAGGRVVVVGGGFIGAEVAATARRVGAEATIVEAEQVPLERAIGAKMGSLLAGVHADQGVDLRCGVPVAGLEGDGRVERVRLADGSVIAADVVVIGLGVRPTTDWLAGSGLATNDGVVCDAFCRASAPGIVAAGDVARWNHPQLGSVRIEHWENAVTQGRVAAGTLLGADDPYDPVPYVWSDQYDLKIQIVGLPTSNDKVVFLDGAPEDLHFVALYRRGNQVTGAISFNRPGSIMKIRRRLRSSATVSEVEGALQTTTTVAT